MNQEPWADQPNYNLAQDDKNEVVELDLTKYGNLEINSGGSKPDFKVVTKVKVVKATLRTTTDRRTEKTRDGKDQSYYPVFLNLEFSYMNNGAELKTFESFSGGRLFVSDESGANRFWVGENSGLGKVKKLVEENNPNYSGEIKQIPEFLQGREVGIKTEKTEVAGKQFTKNNIKVIY